MTRTLQEINREYSNLAMQIGNMESLARRIPLDKEIALIKMDALVKEEQAAQALAVVPPPTPITPTKLEMVKEPAEPTLA